MACIGRQEIFALIKLIRPLLILLVCWAHIPFLHGFYNPSVDTSSLQTVFGVLLRDVISRGGVPVLTVISGYLAYLSFHRKSYPMFVRDKTRRILFPFILWNLIALAYLWWLNHTFDYKVNQAIFEYHSVADFVQALLAINRMPFNPPTYFLRDLFLVLLLCPLVDLLSRRRVVAGAVVVLYGIYMLDTVTLRFGGYGVFYRSDIPFFFFLGYLASRNDLTLPVLPRRLVIGGFVILGVLSLLAAYYLAYSKPEVRDYLKYRPLIGIAYLLALPCLMSFLLPRAESRGGRFLAWLSVYSMTIFLSHQLLATAMRELVPWLGVSMSNHQNLLWQVLFLLIYTGCCVLVGVLLKNLYERAGSVWSRRVSGTNSV